MRLAFLLYQYLPHCGMQRDFRRFVEELGQRGHQCRVYCTSWQDELIAGMELRRVPATALGSHRRHQRYFKWVQADLVRDPVDGVIGFTKMPGLDVYFAAEPCYLDKALRERGPLYRRSARFRHFANMELAVFAPTSTTDILLTAEAQGELFEQHYHTPIKRMHLLSPGVAPDRRAPEDAPRQRRAVRASLTLEPQELALLFVGSEFSTKGLDRAITALAHVSEAQPSVKSRLLVVGQDKQRHFKRLARQLGISEKVEFLGGRDDITELMLGADVLVHPALTEAVGTVLLEALVAGLPVVATDVCGYAHHVKAARAGILLPAPFSQEQLDRAVMRNIDGVFRAECRRSALQYARLTDLYSMHRLGADLIENLVGRKRKVVGAGTAIG